MAHKSLDSKMPHPADRVAGWNRLNALGAALAAAGLLTAMPAAAGPYNTDATETANDSAATPMAATPGTLYQGCVGNTFFDGPALVGAAGVGTQSGCVHNSDGVTLGNDPQDFLSWSGLAAGTAYSFTFSEFPLNPVNDPLNFQFIGGGPSGLVPASGILTVRVFPVNLSEGYNIQLNAQLAAVPEPATGALLAAGLAGAFVARRRKRS